MTTLHPMHRDRPERFSVVMLRSLGRFHELSLGLGGDSTRPPSGV